VAYGERAIAIAGCQASVDIATMLEESTEKTSRIILRFGRGAVILLWVLQASQARAQADEIQVYVDRSD
jgi:hypothetical protein